MTTAYILRRKSLGRTSCREIARLSTYGIEVFRNDNKWYNPETNRYTPKRLPEDARLVIRWGCTSSVPGEPEVLNEASAIHRVNNKVNFRKILQNNGGLCPRTWTTLDEWAEDANLRSMSWPLVIRPSYHAQGRNLWLVHDGPEVIRVCSNLGEGNYYISEFIDKVAEYRVCCVSGRVAWVANKIPDDPSAIAWNVARGGRFENVRWGNWPLEVVAHAIKSFNLSGLDFGGVDVMVDREGNVFTLEINSAPSLTSPYRQQCMAKCLDFIVSVNGPEHFVEQDYLGESFHDYIHPAIQGVEL